MLPLNKSIRNWAGNISFIPREYYETDSVEEIQKKISTSDKNQQIRLVGSKHSFSPLIKTNHTLVGFRKSGLIEVDKKTNEALFWSGTTIKELAPLLEAHNLVLPNQGDVDHQTLAGAFATGTHGTGFDFACLSNIISEIELIDSEGQIRNFNSYSHSDILEGLKINLGLFGVITKFRIKLCETFYLQDERLVMSIDDAIDCFIERSRNVRHAEIFWFPYSKLAQFKELSITTKIRPRPVFEKYISDGVLETLGFGTLCRIAKTIPSLGPYISALSGKLMPSALFSDLSYKVYPNTRQIRFSEMEYAVPVEHFKSCFREMHAQIEKNRFNVFFPIEIRTVSKDDIWISPFYKRDSVVFSIHVYQQLEMRRYFDAMEKIFLKYEGRPHWGKIHTINKSLCTGRFPCWKNFCELRKELDPYGKFLNEELATLFSN